MKKGMERSVEREGERGVSGEVGSGDASGSDSWYQPGKRGNQD